MFTSLNLFSYSNQVAISSSGRPDGSPWSLVAAGLSTVSSVGAASSAWTITVPGSIDASDWRTKGQAPRAPSSPPGIRSGQAGQQVVGDELMAIWEILGRGWFRGAR